MIRDVDLQKRDTHIIYWDDENQLFPRLDLFPDTDVYPEGIEEVGHIVSGTMKLDELIADTELRFGEIFSSKFEVQVFDMPDITNKFIQVYQFDEGEYKGIFSGKIISCKQDNSGLDRTIVAYDMSYVLREKDVSDWWIEYWDERGTSTIKDCRESLLDYMGIVYEDVTLTNDNIVIRKNINASYLAFGTVLSMLCELNGCFPHFNRDNILEFVVLDPTQSVDITDLYEGLNSSFEDYTTDAITGVEFYDSEGELKFVVGDLSNTYKLSSNIFCYDMSSTELGNVGRNLLSYISQIVYTPANIKMVVGDLSYTVGTRVHTPKGDTYILENQYSSAQLVEQVIISNGEKVLGESSRRLTDEMLILNEKYSRLIFNIEEFRTEFVNYQDETESKFQQTSKQITLEVAKGTAGMKATYQGDYVPTGNNYPANTWTTESDRAKNVGSTFYNTAEGRVYRWTEMPNAIALTFDTSCDYTNARIDVFCDINGTIRWLDYGKFSGAKSEKVAGRTLLIPNSTFYLVWDATSTTRKYGFSVASAYTGYENDPLYYFDVRTDARQYLDEYINKAGSATELKGITSLPESEHNPYSAGTKVWHWVTGLSVSSGGSKYGWAPQEGYAYSRIEQTAEMIKSEVAARQFSEDNMYVDLSSKIEQTASKIDMKVSKGNISSELSLEPDKIKLSSGRLIITSGNFKLDEHGTATMQNANVHGEIHCGDNNRGKIDIYDNIVKGNNNAYIDFAGSVSGGNSGGIHLNANDVVFSASGIGVTGSRGGTTVQYGITKSIKCYTNISGETYNWTYLNFVDGICVGG